MEAEKPIRNPATAAAAAVPPFLTKCYDMVDDPATDGTVSWSSKNNSFVIWDPHTFARDLLPKHFKHSNLSSFVRQLNTYGFRKVDPDRYEFAHEGFLRSQKHLLKSITRRKPVQNTSQSQQTQARNTSVKACVEVGKFGLEEEIERLKRDKNVLMQELVKLRQHQQNTDLQLHNLRQSIQGMEQNQKQMLSFFAMAMQSPGFLAQLMQQNGTNRWRSKANKKRRFPALEQGGVDNYDCPSDGQIVKYHPFVTETSNSDLMPMPDTDVSVDLQPMSNAANDLCPSVNKISLGEDLSLPEQGSLYTDFSDFYLEQLLASPLPESDEQNEHAISEFIRDLQLPEEEFQMDTS